MQLIMIYILHFYGLGNLSMRGYQFQYTIIFRVWLPKALITSHSTNFYSRIDLNSSVVHYMTVLTTSYAETQ